MNLELATRIRAAINDTVSSLRPAPGFPEPTRTALQTHLDALLKAELRALIGQAMVADFTEKLNAYIDPRKDTESTPWYPDDSGEWVEVPDGCTVCPLPTTATVEILLLEERTAKKWYPSPAVARGFHWNEPPDSGQRIVAYKVVKP